MNKMIWVYNDRYSRTESKTTDTVELDFIATEMLAFPSKLSRNKNNSDPINGKTTPIQGIIGIISIANSNGYDHFSSLFSWPLDRRYQILFYSAVFLGAVYVKVTAIEH